MVSVEIMHVENPALLIIDMVKDNFIDERNLSITQLARQIIAPINRLSGSFRNRGWPVVFSTDAFQKQDFIFKSKMTPHSLAGTNGAELIDELDRQEDDLWLPKPRFSAFFKTGLEGWLREREITLCAVGGIATNFCVLATVMDAICHDFKAILVEDCSTAITQNLHKQTLDIYRRNPLYPLLKISTSTELLENLNA